MTNFSLIILEITDTADVLTREQFFLNKFTPEYNILKEAGNSKGYKHSEKSKAQIKKERLGKKHTIDVRLKMSSTRRGVNNNFFGKKHSEDTILTLKEYAKIRKTVSKGGLSVEVFDTFTNTKQVYNSIREAAKSLATNMSTLVSRDKRGTTKLYKNRYNITINRP